MRLCKVVLYGCIAGAAAAAAPNPVHAQFCMNARPLPRCSVIAVSELAVLAGNGYGTATLDLGLLRATAESARGASLYVLADELSIGARYRYIRFAGSRSAEVNPGVLFLGDRQGVTTQFALNVGPSLGAVVDLSLTRRASGSTPFETRAYIGGKLRGVAGLATTLGLAALFTSAGDWW